MASRQEMNTRTRILQEATGAINKERQDSYGSPSESFKKIAALWSAYKGMDFTATDVALMMALVKVARLSRSANHTDSWIDLAGYAGLGAEVAPAGTKEI
jgi:Domain of unknown function (DUF6378)